MKAQQYTVREKKSTKDGQKKVDKHKQIRILVKCTGMITRPLNVGAMR
jgi:hypothetical protein